jgi:hypothetical protein
MGTKYFFEINLMNKKTLENILKTIVTSLGFNIIV